MFFGLSFLVVLFCSIYFISDVYIRWSRKPIIITVASTNTLIRNLPFPAVSICNLNKAQNSTLRNIANGATEDALLNSLCYDEYDNLTISNIWNGNSDWSAVRKYLLDISQPCQEMLRFCNFGSETIYCMKLFDTILTDEGLCCSFNPVEPEFLYKNPLNAATNLDNDTYDSRLIPVDWTPEKGYPNKSVTPLSIPRPSPGSGRRLGLYLILHANISDYYCSSTNSAGFKILLHSPVEMPRISNFGMLLHPGRETQIIFTPKLSTESYRARKVPPKSRGCVFADEVQLKFFRTYSRKNCEMECYSRAIEAECGCVIYYMPRLSENAKICTRASSECYNPLRLSIEHGENSKYDCSCYPACDEVGYSGAISTVPLIPPLPHETKLLSNFSNEIIRNDITIVEIFYKEYAFETFVRDEFIGLTEFLSDTGGLLSLFMGFSVVSLVEIFYFIALRFYCGRRTVKRQTDKLNYDSNVSKLCVQYQRWPNTRMYDSEHLDDYVRRKTMQLYGRKY